MHVLGAAEGGDDLTHFCVELNVSVLLLTDDDGALGEGGREGEREGGR